MANPKEIKLINDGLAKMLDYFNKLEVSSTEASKAMAEGMAAINAEAKKGIETNKAANTTRKEGREELTLEQQQAMQLHKAKEGLAAAQTKEAQLIVKTKMQRQDVLKTQKLQIQAGKGEAKTYEQLSARYRTAAKRAKDLAVQYGANSKQAKDAINAAKDYNDELKEVDETLGNHQRNVGNYGDSLGALPGGIGGVIGSIKSMGKAILSSPIGWIVGALALAGGAMKTFFTGSAEGQERWNKTMERAKGIGAVFKDEIIKIGKSLSDLTQATEGAETGLKGFLSNFKKLSETRSAEFKNRVKEIGLLNALTESFKEQAKVVTEYYDDVSERVEENIKRADIISARQNKLRADEREQLVRRAEIQVEIADLVLLTRDLENTSNEEATSALKLATKLKQEEFNAEIGLAKERLAIKQLEMEQGSNTLEDLDEEAALKETLIRLEKTRADQTRELINRQTELQNRIKAQKKAEIAERDKYFNELETSEDDWMASVEESLKQENKLVENSLKDQEKARIEAGKKEIADFEAKEEQKKEALETAGSLVMDTLTMFAEQRLELADQSLDAANIEIAAAEKNLDRQMALAESGYANNVEMAQKGLDLAKKTQDEALAEKKRALEQKQKLEAVEQSVSIITAVANIIQGFSSIPVVGWALGVAAGASMLAAFVGQKRQAKAATQSFGDGGIIDLEGGSHASGNDIHFGNKNGKQLRAEGGEKGAIFSRRATRKYGPSIDRFVHSANKLNLEDRYTRAFDTQRLPAYVYNSASLDAPELNDIKRILTDIRNQGGNRMVDSNGRIVETKGNLTKTIG